MASIFTKIVNGEIPCYKIGEDDKHFAFLDINPVVPGHTLVIPKKEVPYIFHLSDNDLSDLMVFAKKIAGKIEAAIPCKRVAMSVIGLEVPHTHIHLMPIQSESDVDFRHKTELSPEEMKAIAEKISKQL